MPINHMSVIALATLAAHLAGCRAAPPAPSGSPTCVDAGGTACSLQLATGLHHEPESCAWDAQGGQWVVSNMAPKNADLTALDQHGWLTTLAADGRATVEGNNALDAQVAYGLSTPTGVTVIDGRAYVPNVTTVAVVDLAAGTVVQNLDVPGAVFLNDTALGDEGRVYVSDSAGNAIYRFLPGDTTAELFLAAPELAVPNGLLYDEGRGRLLVSCLIDFDEVTPGKLVTIDLATKAVAPWGSLTRKVDGLAWAPSGKVLASDVVGAAIYELDEGGAGAVLFDLKALGLRTAADIGVHPTSGDVCVPDLQNNRVYLLDPG